MTYINKAWYEKHLATSGRSMATEVSTFGSIILQVVWEGNKQ